MKVTLKNVKYAEFQSHETSCFSATIYMDGKSTGTSASNGGYGGCHEYWGGDAHKRLTEYAKTLPKIKTNFDLDGEPFYMEQDADSLVDAALNEFLTQRDLKRMCSTKTCFRIPNETYKEGEYHTLKNKFSPEAKAFLINKYGPDVFILNEELSK